jgi:hypothetical protein
MLKQLIHDKIDEIFLTYQQANNIISGDIEPLDALQLEQIEESLCKLIERVCKYQPKGYSASYTYQTSEGIEYHKSFKQIGIVKFFTEISNIIAFSDCTDYTVINICFEGKEIEYAGWQPNMRFEYKDLDGNTVWVGVFEHWDH